MQAQLRQAEATAQAAQQRAEATAQAAQQVSETRWNWLVSIIVSEFLPRCQDFRYFFESIVPAMAAGVNPVYPDGPPAPQPTRQLEVWTRPQYDLDDVAEFLWSNYCTLPSWQRPLNEMAPVFHTAGQEAAAATVIQATARVWKARKDLPRLRAVAEFQRRSVAATVIVSAFRIYLAMAKLIDLRIARHHAAAVTIQRIFRGRSVQYKLIPRAVVKWSLYR